MRRTLSILILTLFTLLALAPFTAMAESKNHVYVLRIDGRQVIDEGLVQITNRAFEEAAADPNAVAVAVVVDTPGGLVQSATKIKGAILGTKLRTVAYVSGGAESAGALIATAGEKLYMHPDATIGAAEPRLAGTNQKADYKTLSAVVATFRATAEARGRDPNIAQAMVDKDAKIPGQTTELLVMTAKDAVAKRYADGLAGDLGEALRNAGITDYKLVNVVPTLSEQAGRFLTNPWVALLLLVVGIVAIGIEFIKPGVTVPGLVGIVSLGLFFIGNVLVGTAGWFELALALVGIALVIVEAFIPGFGIFGVGGIVAMAASIFFAVPTTELAMRYLLFASIAFAFTTFAIVRYIGRRGLGKALTLEQSLAGAVPARADLTTLVGKQGKSLTVLRPAGTAQFGAEKVDVVTEGEFVPAGTPVTVIRAEGTRVVVRSVE